jgi:hypothetical protein
MSNTDYFLLGVFFGILPLVFALLIEEWRDK